MKRTKSPPPTQEELSRGTKAIGAARKHFRRLRDPRLAKGKRHRLVDTVLIALLGVICDCDDADEIADWAELHQDWLTDWFELEHGTPSQDTILRVFAALNPKTFTESLMSWLASLRPSSARHIAIDGKTLRGSLDAAQGKGAVHIVNAWLREAGLVLGQVKTSEKSNEITAIPQLLALLDIEGCTVSIDAGGCYRGIAAQVVDQKGDYVLAVKDNQPTLRQDLERLFTEALDTRRRSRDELERPALTSIREADGGHGRVDERVVYVAHDLDWLTTREQWKGLAGAIMVESRRTNVVTSKETIERRYYITSDATMTAERALGVTRGHWSVENNLHWVLDVVFGEDASRIRTERAAENFGMLRRLALSLLGAAPPPKKGMSIKRRRHYCGAGAPRSRTYVETVLSTARSQA
jgi:predicted transposase YbfD/YdcC